MNKSLTLLEIIQRFYGFDHLLHGFRCNSSNFGVLRYFSTKLQLCTPKGWRYLAFSEGEVPPCSFPNVPEANIEAFYAADPGLMFQFNKEFTGLVNPPNSYNITTGKSFFNELADRWAAVGFLAISHGLRRIFQREGRRKFRRKIRSGK